MTPDLFVKGQIAIWAWREAHHIGGSHGMMAMAFMLRNRQRAAWQGGDWLALLANCDATRAARAPVQGFPDLREPSFRDFLQKIDQVYDGLLPDTMVEGALYCHELNLPASKWFKTNIIDKPEDHPRVAIVGPITFFK